MPPKTKAKAAGRKHVHYTMDLEGCPRCGGDHEGEPQKDADGNTIRDTGAVMFTPLNNPEDRNDLWGFCGVAGQPILLASEDVD